MKINNKFFINQNSEQEEDTLLMLT